MCCFYRKDCHVPSAVLLHVWELLNDIQNQFFKSLEFVIGPVCPMCCTAENPLPSQTSLMIKSHILDPDSERTLHILPLATNVTADKGDCSSQFDCPVELYCNTRAVSASLLPIKQWLQIAQVGNVGCVSLALSL